VQQALKKQIITVFEPMYLNILNDDMVGFANISARVMFDHIFITYGNITTVDLENNFEHMRRAWDPQQPVESLFKQIQDCADYSETGGALIGFPQQIKVGYAKIFTAGHFMSACRRWNEKPHAEKLSHNLRPTSPPPTVSTGKCKVNLPQHPDTTLPTQLSDKTEDQMAKATIGALSNLTTATAADRGVVATLTEANTRLAKQLEDNSNELRELKALIKKERTGKRGQRSFNPSPNIYCWTHGYKVANTHTSLSCNFPKQVREATRADKMGGSQSNKE
jgi:hypothetical protein